MNHGIHRIHGMVLLAVAALGTSLAAFAADPAITVEAQQRYPWNGLVDVTITGDAGTKYDTSFTAKDMVGNTNIAMRTVRKSDGTSANVEGEALYPGTYHWVWDAAADLPDGFQCERVTMAATADEWNPLYMVVDLSGGPDSNAYPVSYLDVVPSGGWSDEYKTTKLVLRRCEAGTFTQCNKRTVTLSESFYIGVFEVTQKQYTLITGNNPSSNKGDNRPVEEVSYDNIRGSSKGQEWPSSSAVDSDSVIGKLRSRTGLSGFDLPTEAQWEYACHAGTTTDPDIAKYGRYAGNVSDGKGGYSQHTVCGSYLPNDWGIYDMRGNVWEWVCDGWGSTGGDIGTTPVTDPKGVTPISHRVLRGGSWSHGAEWATSTARNYSIHHHTHYQPHSPQVGNGFRVCVTISK